MKTFFITAFILLSYIHLNAQQPVEKLEALKQMVSKINPNIDFSNKLIFISAWKSDDFESREMNKEAYRVYKIYRFAKLKNGESGTVFISLNLDENEQNKAFAIGKDGLDASDVYSNQELINLVRADFNSVGPQNTLVLDKTGAIQYTNIPKDQIFPSLRNLITR